MTRLGVAAESIFDRHHFIDTLIGRADHLAEVVGCVMPGLEKAWFTAFLAPGWVLRTSVSMDSLPLTP